MAETVYSTRRCFAVVDGDVGLNHLRYFCAVNLAVPLKKLNHRKQDSANHSQDAGAITPIACRAGLQNK